MSTQPFLTVQALTKYIKRKFDADPHLRNVYVKGELSNVKLHSSGHIYFTLKDDQTKIQAAMFRSRSSSLQFKPENGMNVLITGDVTVYETAGSYQLYVQTMEPDGIGALYLAFEQLKRQLQAEGLFDMRFKQPIPRIPKRIGIITAKTGAVLRDMYTTINRRFPLTEIVLFPAIVQGREAAPSIVKAIEQANRTGGIDVLIAGRGGGSIEDLWAFNEETVARAIFSSRIPIISAVGHETDTTIADYAADLRAPTPTAAAELAVPDQKQLMQLIQNERRAIYSAVNGSIQQQAKRLEAVSSSYVLQYPERLYRPFIEKLAHLQERFERGGQTAVQEKRMQFDRLHAALQYNSPVRRVELSRLQARQLTERIERAAEQNIRHNKQQFLSLLRMMQALNPLQVMERGFSIAYKEQNVVNSVSEIAQGEKLTIDMTDGSVETVIQTIIPKETK